MLECDLLLFVMMLWVVEVQTAMQAGQDEERLNRGWIGSLWGAGGKVGRLRGGCGFIPVVGAGAGYKN